MNKLIKEASYLVPAAAPRGQIQREGLDKTPSSSQVSVNSPLCGAHFPSVLLTNP